MLIKIGSIALIILGLVAGGYAADSTDASANPWKIQFQSGIGVTQSSYSDSWTGGEAGSLIWMSNFLGQAEKKISQRWLTTNQLKLEFGQTHSQDETTKKWKSPAKSVDKIRFDGLLRYTMGWAVDPYGAVIFESQFLDVSSPVNKRYLNPIDLTETVGIARTIVKSVDVYELTTRLGVGFRQGMIRSDDITDSSKTISKTISNSGLEWVMDLKVGTAKTTTGFDSKLTVFKALSNSKADELKGLPSENYWQTADLNWDNILRINLNSVMQISLAWQLLYDKEISLSGRFKETLTLGASYKFVNFK